MALYKHTTASELNDILWSAAMSLACALDALDSYQQRPSPITRELSDKLEQAHGIVQGAQEAVEARKIGSLGEFAWERPDPMESLPADVWGDYDPFPEENPDD